MKKIIILLLVFCGSVVGATEDDLEISYFGSFLHTKNVPNALFFFSDIQKNDSFELRRALRTHQIDTIVLASAGGSVWEGLNMAGIIFDKKMTTYVPNFPEAEGCYSACSFMFFAGQARITEGELGVHQVGAYNKVVDNQKHKLGETQQATQYTTSEVIGFLNEFNTPPWVYERMFRSREIYLFTQEEKKLLNVGSIEVVQKQLIDDFLISLISKLKERPEDESKPNVVVGLDISDAELVKAFQLALNDAKCSAGLADGVWGKRTHNAASRFASANRLKYSGPNTINEEYISVIRSSKRTDCNIPVTKKVPNWLSRNWAFDFVCKGERTSGFASFSFRSTQNGKRSYGINFISGSGKTYVGIAKVDRYAFTFNAIQQGTSNKLSGGGKFFVRGGQWRLNGTSSGDCSFVAVSKS